MNNSNGQNKDYFSNCMISGPIFHPGLQIKGFNGLAWSNIFGMIHQTDSQNLPPANTWIAD